MPGIAMQGIKIKTLNLWPHENWEASQQNVKILESWTTGLISFYDYRREKNEKH